MTRSPNTVKLLTESYRVLRSDVLHNSQRSCWDLPHTKILYLKFQSRGVCAPFIQNLAIARLHKDHATQSKMNMP